MSGLKINYHKSEVVTFGYEEEQQRDIANALNCKIGQLPMTYLGFPISDKHLGAKAFGPTVEKMRKKLQPWKGKNLTSGGRLILTNSSLSNMPIYIMGIYHLQDGVHQQMDMIRSQFFWRGDCSKFKYHMVRWENVCLPKDFGGLGVLNTKLMNEALLTKWVWRIQNNQVDDICCQLIRTKYLGKKTLQQCNGRMGSQFWKGINSVKKNFSWEAKHIVNNGKDTSFWDDVWVGGVPLRLVFPKLYEHCRDRKCTVNDCWIEGEWKLE